MGDFLTIDSTDPTQALQEPVIPSVIEAGLPFSELPQDDPFASRELFVHVMLHVVVGFVALLLSWVPFRLLWKHGELAAVIFISINALFIVLSGVNAALWPDNNTANWFRGYGWCDLQIYLHEPLRTAYATSLCAIVRNLALQISDLRANPLSVSERRRKNLFQLIFIFSAPLVYAAFLFPVTYVRYDVLAIVGCQARTDLSWLDIVVGPVPANFFAVLAGFYGGERLHVYPPSGFGTHHC
jgi:pheromone a factor receptor